jgi:hypothetical protein
MNACPTTTHLFIQPPAEGGRYILVTPGAIRRECPPYPDKWLSFKAFYKFLNVLILNGDGLIVEEARGHSGYAGSSK